MKRTLELLLRRKVPPVRVFRGDCLPKDQISEDADQSDQELDFQDRTDQEQAEAETFWAGRNLAMRRSARVAA